ncbi:hypothetical protein MBLNU230_g2351t1 [Neophaeotheca triangularis]
MSPSPPQPPQTSPPLSTAPPLTPHLVASTGNLTQDDSTDIYYQDAQWTPDGTTLLTHTSDQKLSTYILPPDLLSSHSPQSLQPYLSTPCPTRIQATTPYPFYNLQEPSTTLLLSSPTALPIRLTNTVYPHTHASYPYINPSTEAYIAPSALRFTRDGRHFIAGQRDALAIFDVSRDGSGPVQSYATTVSRKAKKLYGARSMGCGGKIMGLDVSGEEGWLAVGTTERDVAVYGGEGRGECVTALNLKGLRGGGTGVMQVRWCEGARYLVVAERQSEVVRVLDVRGGFRLLGSLEGRRADTTQRLGVDVVSTAEGEEVWAGGTNGFVRGWKGVGDLEGDRGPDFEWKLHDDAVSSAAWHPGGAVLATCSGQRHFPAALEEDSESSSSASDESSVATQTHGESSLKVWSF